MLSLRWNLFRFFKFFVEGACSWRVAGFVAWKDSGDNICLHKLHAAPLEPCKYLEALRNCRKKSFWVTLSVCGPKQRRELAHEKGVGYWPPQNRYWDLVSLVLARLHICINLTPYKGVSVQLEVCVDQTRWDLAKINFPPTNWNLH